MPYVRDVAAAYGTFCTDHALAARRARNHVTTLEKNAVNASVHADATQFAIRRALRILATALQIFCPKPCHPFDEFTLLKAALVVHVTGFEKLLKLAHTETFNLRSAVD